MLMPNLLKLFVGNYRLSFTWATKLYINFDIDIPKVTKEIMPKGPPKGLDG